MEISANAPQESDGFDFGWDVGGFDGDYGGLGMSFLHTGTKNTHYSHPRAGALDEPNLVQVELQSGSRRSSDVGVFFLTWN